MKKETTPMSYKIRTPVGFVHGFDKRNQVVVITESPEDIKLFPTINHAEQFISDFADAGFGLESKTCVLIPA